MDTATVRQHIDAATDRCVRDVARLTDEALRGPSVLPGWSRAHVVAHLAGNALGQARALDGLAGGRPVPVYDSRRQRDADIDAWSRRSAGQLHDLCADACRLLRRAWDRFTAVSSDQTAEVEHTPGTGVLVTPATMALARWHEVEIHHVDLDVGYSPSDWSTAFTDHLLARLVEDRSHEDLTLRLPTHEVVLGSGGPVVEGAGAAVAYWLSGRDRGHGLGGDLPALPPWR